MLFLQVSSSKSGVQKEKSKFELTDRDPWVRRKKSQEANARSKNENEKWKIKALHRSKIRKTRFCCYTRTTMFLLFTQLVFQWFTFVQHRSTPTPRGTKWNDRLILRSSAEMCFYLISFIPGQSCVNKKKNRNLYSITTRTPSLKATRWSRIIEPVFFSKSRSISAVCVPPPPSLPPPLADTT